MYKDGIMAFEGGPYRSATPGLVLGGSLVLGGTQLKPCATADGQRNGSTMSAEMLADW
jgi:hypothetical protein